MSNLVKSVGGFVNTIFGGSTRKKKKPLTDLVMPDEVELQRQARRKQALLAQRGGRRSTILDDETLG